MLGATVTSAVSILHSLGVLSLMAIGISMLQPSRLDDAPGRRRSLVMGLVFGATVAVVMADPVIVVPGTTLDPRGAPAMLAGIYGGPVAAVTAAAMGSAMRWWIGGAGAPAGMLGLAVYAIVGMLAWSRLRRSGQRPTAGWFLALAVIGTALVLPTAFALPDWRDALRLLSTGWWLALTGNTVGVLVLGFLLEQDWRRRHLEHELRRTEVRTRAAAEAKTRFLASMSHEIRTPMNAVVGFVDLLRDTSLDSFQRRCTDQIREATQGLLRIIDDILEFAKADAGVITLHPRPVDIAALAASCRELLRPQVDGKGVDCVLDISEPLPAAIEADPVRLRQVLLNLLGNAVKFTDAGRIVLALRFTPKEEGNGELVVTVTDTGIGMTADEQARLFSPFAQGDHAGRGGTGLGLVVSRMLVQAMNGELSLASTPGKGTTATLRLPVRTLPADAAPDPEPVPVEPNGAGPLRILVAEDVALNAEMLQATLEQLRHVVHVVVDGRQALDAVRSAPFDMVLMDVQMPVMDGLEATRAIRALNGGASAIPIIALTAYASRGDLKACLDAGMNDFLTKPLERAKLQEVLQRWGGARTAPDAMPRPAVEPAVEPAGEPAGEPAPEAAAEPAVDAKVERLEVLLAELAAVERDDRDAVRRLADALVSAAENARLPGLADRARRLAAASLQSNAEALGALVEDLPDAGRRELRTVGRRRHGDGR